jgi:hypothetical protein
VSEHAEIFAKFSGQGKTGEGAIFFFFFFFLDDGESKKKQICIISAVQPSDTPSSAPSNLISLGHCLGKAATIGDAAGSP